MKHIYIAFIMLASLGLFSCEKDETIQETLPITEVKAPELNLEGMNNYIAEESTLDIFPSILSWTNVNFGDPDILGTYTIQVDTTPDFTTSKEKSVGINTYSYSLSGKQLNEWSTGFNLDANDLQDITLFFRVAASVYVNSPSSILNKPDSVYSESVNITVKPILVETPVIYVPGNQQGWNPALATKLYSSGRDNVYTGYVYLDGEFKLTAAPDWELAYGAGSSAGTLSTSGGNLIATKGYYWASVNIPALTYVLTSVEWSVIGSALQGGWDEDALLSYDPAKEVLSLTTEIKTGEFKFRRDKSWDLSLGKGESDGILTADNGANIIVDTAGKYTITLDLSDPEDLRYTLTKL